jgi:hypothetical protein
VRELRALTPEEFQRVAERLRNPRPGSRIAAAKEHGVDLTLLIEQLRLSPAERVRKMQDLAEAVERLRGAARRTRE